MIKLRSVGVIMTNREHTGCYVCLRHATCSTYPNYLQVAGGKLNDGESDLDGAIREMREETGIIPSSLSLLYSGTFQQPSGSYYISTHYVTVVESNPKNTEPEKHGEWEWKEWREILSARLMPGTRASIEHLLGLPSHKVSGSGF